MGARPVNRESEQFLHRGQMGQTFLFRGVARGRERPPQNAARTKNRGEKTKTRPRARVYLDTGTSVPSVPAASGRRMRQPAYQGRNRDFPPLFAGEANPEAHQNKMLTMMVGLFL